MGNMNEKLNLTNSFGLRPEVIKNTYKDLAQKIFIFTRKHVYWLYLLESYS